MAAPMVTGVVALIIGSGNNDITSKTGKEKVEAVESKLISSAKNIGSSAKFGAGMVNEAVAVGELSITSQTQRFEVASGKNLQLVEAYTSAELAKNVTWSSSDTTVAKVTKGKVVAAKNLSEKKTVEITATAADKKTSSVTITVFPASSTNISTTDKGPYTLVCYTDVSGADFRVSAGDMPIVYSSSNKKIAGVDSEGHIDALGNGKAVITAKTIDGKQSLTCKVNVIMPLILGVMKSKNRAEEDRYDLTEGYYPVAAGTTLNLGAYTSAIDLEYFPGLKNPTNKRIDWSSSDSSALKVKNGKVTTDKNISKSTIISVTAKPADGYFKGVTRNVCVFDPIVALSFEQSKVQTKKTIELSVGQTDSVSIYPFTKSKEGTCYSKVTYTNGNENVVSWENGKVIAKKKGTAKIVFKSKDGTNKSAALTVIVK